MKLKLKLLEESYSIVRLGADEAIPPWALEGRFFNVIRTAEELSFVTESSRVPPPLRQQGPWRAFMLQGPFDFDLCGVLLAVLAPLAEAKIGIFALSTFDTDYVLVKAEKLERAKAALGSAGHDLIVDDLGPAACN